MTKFLLIIVIVMKIKTHVFSRTGSARETAKFPPYNRKA